MQIAICADQSYKSYEAALFRLLVRRSPTPRRAIRNRHRSATIIALAIFLVIFVGLIDLGLFKTAAGLAHVIHGSLERNTALYQSMNMAADLELLQQSTGSIRGRPATRAAKLEIPIKPRTRLQHVGELVQSIGRVDDAPVAIPDQRHDNFANISRDDVELATVEGDTCNVVRDRFTGPRPADAIGDKLEPFAFSLIAPLPPAEEHCAAVLRDAALRATRAGDSTPSPPPRPQEPLYKIWPALLYHPTEKPRLVKNAHEAAELGICYREATFDERCHYGCSHVWDWQDGCLWRPQSLSPLKFDAAKPGGGEPAESRSAWRDRIAVEDSIRRYRASKNPSSDGAGWMWRR